MKPHELMIDGYGLLSKFGYSDGDMCNDYFEEKVDCHKLICLLVKTHLQPLLDDRVELFEIVTGHNPIRATDETYDFVDPTISVTISDKQIQECIELIKGDG